MTGLSRAFVAALLVGAATGCGTAVNLVTVPEGTSVAIRLTVAVASDTSHVGDVVEGTLLRAVLVDGVEVVPAGSLLTGHVTTATPSGKVKGLASLAMQFQTLAVEGQRETYAISAGVSQTAEPTKGKDALKIGVPAAAGAGIGALLGGKKGAGVGALIGGGAGTAVVLDSAGSEVRFSNGATLPMVLDRAIDVRTPSKKR
jgi:hypothetical protein